MLQGLGKDDNKKLVLVWYRVYDFFTSSLCLGTYLHILSGKPAPILQNILVQKENPNEVLHCIKRLASFPSPAGLSLTKLSWPGIIKLFPAKESLVSDIPAWDGKNDNLFYSVISRISNTQSAVTLIVITV
jgi:hypothetical protein